MQMQSMSAPGRNESARTVLSMRQIEILYWVQEGKSGPDIGTILGISGRTVDKHLENICETLGVRRRLQAVLRARDLGLLGPDVPLRETTRRTG
jgi:LuxR family maltose regulon positive regulatory protein